MCCECCEEAISEGTDRFKCSHEDCAEDSYCSNVCFNKSHAVATGLHELHLRVGKPAPGKEPTNEVSDGPVSPILPKT